MNKSTLVLITILAVGLAISASFNAFEYLQNHNSSSPQEHGNTPFPENRVLINGTITVDSDDAYCIEFLVPDGASDIQVTGNFLAVPNNTVKVYVATENNLNSLSPSFSPFYDSELSTRGNLNLSLPSGGIYYLVYDNHNYLYNWTQSPEKIVNTQVILSFTVRIGI